MADKDNPLLTGSWSNDYRLALYKRVLKEILNSYHSSYDTISEMIQNSIDAIERKWQDGDQKKKGDGQIIVKVDFNANTLTVIDNGCGIEEDDWSIFFTPFSSLKPDEVLEFAQQYLHL